LISSEVVNFTGDLRNLRVFFLLIGSGIFSSPDDKDDEETDLFFLNVITFFLGFIIKGV
jgi:hypothetical protein